MSKKIQLTLSYDEDLESSLITRFPGMLDYRILNQALDARGASRGKTPRYNYTIEIIQNGEKFSGEKEEFTKLKPFDQRPIIIGAGPGGLFCALRLAEYGIPSLVIERGERAHDRMKHIAAHWRHGKFNPESNVCYGEGGAGLFSDGKLITRVKSPYVQYVMNKLVEFGAPKETAYLSNPHLGSNKIRLLINKISDNLKEKGCQVLYNSRMAKLLTDPESPSKIIGVELESGEKIFSPHVILATGHSAGEVYRHLEEIGVAMAPKDFAVGVRIEHSRKIIDRLQYGDFVGAELGAARYRLSYHDEASERGTYSFCMCPGGYVLSSGTDQDGLVVNGMSNYARNSPWSNAALVVSVKAGRDFDASENVLAGLQFQRDIEKRAFNFSIQNATGKEAPAQSLKDFLSNTRSGQLPKTSCPSGIVSSSLHEILPDFISKHISHALTEFESNLKGFVTDQALLLAPETRTSAPVTILRNRDSLESESHSGLYPCGEGAGHAGGITSAAVDGIKIAMSLLQKERGFES
jgi:uncharacterized FAD-dependent dehydrogenase